MRIRVIVSLSLLLAPASGCDEGAVLPPMEGAGCPAPVAGPVGEGCMGLGDFVHTVGLVNTDGDAAAVALSGSIACVADGEGGVLVVDACDAGRPRVLSRVPTGAPALDVAVLHGHLYVATEGGLEVWDARDPGRPSALASVRGAGAYRGIDVDPKRRLAFVADGVAGLVIYDVSRPYRPRVVGVENTPGQARGVFVDGPVAYVADAVLGLRIASVSVPEAPWLIRAVDTPGQATAVSVWNTLAVVADGPAGLTVVDVTAPNAAAVVGNADTPDFLADVAVSGGLAFAAERSEGLLVYSLANPASPGIRARSAGEGFAAGVAVAGGVAFMADGFAGLRVVDARRPSPLPEQARLAPFGGVANAITAQENRFYVADENIGVYLGEWCSDHFVRLDEIHPGDTVHDLVLYEGRLYVCADDRGVQIVDVSNPGRLVIVGEIPGTAGAVRVALADSVAFTVRGGFTQPTIVDLRHLDDPPTGVNITGGVVRAVAVGSEYAYFVQVQGRLHVATREPGASQPVQRVYSTRGNSTDVHVRGGAGPGGERLFIANRRGIVDPETGIDFSAGVEVYSLSTPLVPAFLGLIETSIPAERIAFDGDVMYVSGGEDGLEVIDVSDVYAPVPVGAYWRNVPVRDAVVVPGAVLVVAGEDGIISLPPLCE